MRSIGNICDLLDSGHQHATALCHQCIYEAVSMIFAEDYDYLTVWFVNNDRCGIALSRLFRRDFRSCFQMTEPSASENAATYDGPVCMQAMTTASFVRTGDVPVLLQRVLPGILFAFDP